MLAFVLHLSSFLYNKRDICQETITAGTVNSQEKKSLWKVKINLVRITYCLIFTF